MLEKPKITHSFASEMQRWKKPQIRILSNKKMRELFHDPSNITSHPVTQGNPDLDCAHIVHRYYPSGPWNHDYLDQNNSLWFNSSRGPSHSFGCCVAVSLVLYGSGSILAVFLRSSGAPAISWCLTLDFIGVLQWLQTVLRDIDCPAPPRQAPHNADEWTCGPAKSN